MRLLLCGSVLVLFSLQSIARDPGQVRVFRATHPCPSTNKTTGACFGYVVDHIKPLCAGGLDHPSNMAWQAFMKSKEKDKIEIAFCRCMARDLIVCK